MARTKKVNDGPPVLVNGMRPHDPETLTELAKQFWGDGKTPANLNKAVMSESDYDKLIAARQTAKDEGKKLPSMPNMYQPALAQMVHSLGGLTSQSAQEDKSKRKPAGWDDNILGSHKAGIALRPVRLMHIADIRKEVADGALAKVGNYEFVVGRKPEGGEWVAAPFNIDGSKTGNYLINIQVVKEFSYSEITVAGTGEKVSRTDFDRVVGRINNAVETVKDEEGHLVVCPPYTHVTWGHLMKDGAALTAAQIHALKDNKGVSFTPIKGQWIGRSVTRGEWWKEVRRRMDLAATKRGESDKTLLDRFEGRKSRSSSKDGRKETPDKAWFNVFNTQCRFSADAWACFGYRFPMVGQALGHRFTDKLDGVLFACLGGFLPAGHETLHDAKRRLKPADATPAPAKPKAAKPKVAKPKSDKKKAPKKSKKAPKPKVTASDAPPVVDTPVAPPQDEESVAEADAMQDALSEALSGDDN